MASQKIITNHEEGNNDVGPLTKFFGTGVVGAIYGSIFEDLLYSSSNLELNQIIDDISFGCAAFTSTTYVGVEIYQHFKGSSTSNSSGDLENDKLLNIYFAACIGTIIGSTTEDVLEQGKYETMLQEHVDMPSYVPDIPVDALSWAGFGIGLLAGAYKARKSRN